MIRRASIALALLLIGPSAARAGMPSVTLTEIARMRFEALSFFGACFLACAWIIQRVWNGLRTDFPKLPRLSYGRAVGVMSLWGLLFLLVLTMISGARELMTPGAWRKEGYTFKVNEPSQAPPDDPSLAVRREALERLKVVLWDYAKRHDGHLPPDDKVAEVPEDLWRVPDPSGLRYVYEGGLFIDKGASPVAYEPGLFGSGRMTLLTSGVVRRMTLDEIRDATPKGGPR
jgi:hypothetical protein